ncbi:MAG: TRAP transporter small permease [Thermovenabulum sp.]|uniref:TRAP transporter small permease n=1 Tax=Thermovenabulum sp. TaxID=3100335 RepID=UPI003C7CC68B
MTFKKFIDGLDNVVKWMAIAMFSIMTVAIVLQVLFRYVIHSSLSWSEELARYLFVWSVLLGSAMCVKRRSHVGVEVFMMYLPKNLQKYGVFLADIFGLIFYGILIVYGFNVVKITMNQSSASLGIKMGYPYLSIPVAGIVMFLNGLYNMIEDFKQFKKNDGVVKA